MRGFCKDILKKNNCKVPWAKAVSYFLLENTLPILISGNSMYPILKDGEYIDIHPFSQNLTLGKCYAFLYSEIIICHRLIAMNGDVLVFSGDNNKTFEYILKSNIVAETAFTDPFIRRFLIILYKLTTLYLSYTLHFLRRRFRTFAL